MKQFQLSYKNDTSFRKALDAINKWCAQNPSYTTIFRIYSEDMDKKHIKHVCDIIDDKMPNALYLGCSTHANILNGELAKSKIVMSCTIFEYETTQTKILQYPFTEENAVQVVDELKEYCDKNPWISAVEMHATMLGMSVREFCNEMSDLKKDIQIFGGGAYNPHMDNVSTFVFSKGNDFTEHGIVFLLLGGKDFHTYSTYIAGWKPLTRAFTVTKADGATLYELDGQPAFDVYQRYLNIKNDSGSIIANTLEFPLFMDYKDVYVLRCPLGLNDDGSLTMATETPEGSHVRIAYGDPETILRDIRHDGQKIAAFQPDVIQAFSCAARKAFWGDDNVGDETTLFNSIAPTSGFYTSGEFILTNDAMRNFNITLVIAAMREGDPQKGEVVDLYDSRLDNIESETRTPLIRRFVAFIEATTKEIEETNRKLEETNRKLAILSITDGLTGLYNRTETERRIRKALNERTKKGVSLIMLDLDDFKKVNDVCGHAEGDKVLIALSDVLRSVMEGANASVGRWGGEEFMILVPDCNIDTAAKLAEKVRKEFSRLSFELAGHQTVSLGVCEAKDGETADALCSRVDDALYAAKDNGKNQVVKQG